MTMHNYEKSKLKLKSGNAQYLAVDLTDSAKKIIELPTEIVITRIEWIAPLNRLTRFYIRSNGRLIAELPFNRASMDWWDLCKSEINTSIHSERIVEFARLRGPTPPLNTTAQFNGSNIDISWQSPADSGDSPIDQYEVYGTDNAAHYYGKLGTVPANQFSFTYQNYDPNKHYYMFVQARSSVGYSQRSNEASPESNPNPEPLPALTISNTRSIIQLQYREVEQR
jgi:hypothetical protein